MGLAPEVSYFVNSFACGASPKTYAGIACQKLWHKLIPRAQVEPNGGFLISSFQLMVYILKMFFKPHPRDWPRKQNKVWYQWYF